MCVGGVVYRSKLVDIFVNYFKQKQAVLIHPYIAICVTVDNYVTTLFAEDLLRRLVIWLIHQEFYSILKEVDLV